MGQQVPVANRSVQMLICPIVLCVNGTPYFNAICKVRVGLEGKEILSPYHLAFGRIIVRFCPYCQELFCNFSIAVAVRA